MEGATVTRVPGLVEKVFPDTLFQRLLEPHEEIAIIDGSHLLPQGAQTTDWPFNSKGSGGETGETLNDAIHASPQQEQYAGEVAESSKIHDIRAQREENKDKESRSEERQTGHPKENGTLLDDPPKISSGDSTKEDHRFLAIDYIFKDLCGSEQLYDVNRKEWIDWPERTGENSKGKVAECLNKILGRVRTVLYGTADSGDDWIFGSTPPEKSVKKGSARRMPGLMLIRRKFKQSFQDAGWELDWKRVRVIGAVSTTSRCSRQHLGDESRGFFCKMYEQDMARRFGLMFGLFNVNMALFKYDRSGCHVSPRFNIHENPKDFLRVIVGMAFGEDYYLGLDPSFANEGGKNYIMIDGTKYEITKVIHIAPAILGRGTVVLRVIDPATKQTLVVKDQWTKRDVDLKEVDILLKMQMKGKRRKTIRLVSSKVIAFKIGGLEVLDSTGVDTEGTAEMGECNKIRDHYRLLLSPYGDSLWRFESLRELISVFKDYAESIRDLYMDGYYHCDISYSNLIIVSTEDAELVKGNDSEAAEDDSEPRVGFLIDFDCATTFEHMEPELVGTTLFMPVEMLMDGACSERKYYFDLESLFYVLVTVCLLADGPREKGYYPSSGYKIKGSTLGDWREGTEILAEEERLRVLRQIGHHKLSIMGNHRLFSTRILDQLTPYFEPIKDLLLELRGILFQLDSVSNTPESLKPIPKHKDIDRFFERYIECLKRARDKLPAEDPWPEDSEEVSSDDEPPEVQNIAQDIQESNEQRKCAKANGPEAIQGVSTQESSPQSSESNDEDPAATSQSGTDSVADSGYHSITAAKRKNSERSLTSLTSHSKKRGRGEDLES